MMQGHRLSTVACTPTAVLSSHIGSAASLMGCDLWPIHSAAHNVLQMSVGADSFTSGVMQTSSQTISW